MIAVQPEVLTFSLIGPRGNRWNDRPLLIIVFSILSLSMGRNLYIPRRSSQSSQALDLRDSSSKIGDDIAAPRAAMTFTNLRR